MPRRSPDSPQTGRGVVEGVTVEVGNRVATLPAASFAGAGDVLVTGMTKGQLQNAAEQQEQAASQPASQGSHRAERGNTRDR